MSIDELKQMLFSGATPTAHFCQNQNIFYITNMKQRIYIDTSIVGGFFDSLANAYINENVVGATSLDDCQHIAIATINKVDILASWNFKHIVNINRIRGYNGVNLKKGYATLEIRNPRELIDYEN